MTPERLRAPFEEDVQRQINAAGYVAVVISSGGKNVKWMEGAICKGIDPNLFHSDSSAEVKIAKEICKECPVKDPCLEYALITNQDHGVWGGTSERQRRNLRRGRRL